MLLSLELRLCCRWLQSIFMQNIANRHENNHQPPKQMNEQSWERRRERSELSNYEVLIDREPLVTESTLLIPPDLLDHASQRLFVVSFFILIQAWKIYDLVLLKSVANSLEPLTQLSSFTFVVKYAIIDGLYLWILPVLEIPQLVFTPLRTLMLTVVMNVITIALMSSFTTPLLSVVVLPVWNTVFKHNELTILGDTINAAAVVDMDSYFKGTLTIHYLPDSSARFNPFHFDRSCLDIGQAFQMPIEFNTTTDLGYLQLSHYTPGNQVKLLNYSGNALKKLVKKDYGYLLKYSEYKRDPRISYIEIPLKEPGLYKINSVTDLHRNSIRTYRSEFMISLCPQAKYSYPPRYTTPVRCLSSQDPFTLPLVDYNGILPATFRFTAKLNGKHVKTFNTTIGEKPAKGVKKDLSWLEAQEISRNILEQEIAHHPLTNLQEGTLEFQLNEVIDYLGNSKKYNPGSRDQDVWFEYQLKRSPVVGLSIGSTELLVGRNKDIKLKGQLHESEFPVSVVISFVGVSELLSYNISQTFKNHGDWSRGVIVDKPGNYKLISAKSKFCECEIKLNEIKLTLATPPTAEIAAKAILDKCVGTTGYTFDLTLAGKAPFSVQYHVYRNQSSGLIPVPSSQGVTARYLKTKDTKYSFTFSPPAEGNYVIVFNELKDANYFDHPVKFDERKYTYLTYFKQISKVGFGKGRPHQISTCSGAMSKIPLHFTGNGPFSFKYDFIDLTGKKLGKTVTVTDVSEYEIVTPALLNGKSFNVVLSALKDKFSCGGVVDEQEVYTIKSRGDIAELKLSGKSSYTIVEGDTVDIPLVLTSSVGRSNSDKVTYLFTNAEGTVIHRAVHGGAQSLRVKEAGVYSLVSFENSGCGGTVTSQNIEIKYHPKPELTVTSDNIMKQHVDGDLAMHLNLICQNCEQPIKLLLVGSAPFVVDYEIELPHGLEQKTMSVETHELIINLPSKASGLYKHRFTAMYDKLYTRQKHTPNLLASLQYSVHELPNVRFPSETSQICENQLKKLVRVPLEFSGAYPFTFHGTLTHELTGEEEEIVLEDITQPFIEISKVSKLGEHILTVRELIDGNGCKRQAFDELNRFVVSVTPMPGIVASSKQHFCVGDHITYNLTGSPPFNIFYLFNGKKQRADKLYSFERLASKPGILNVNGIEDHKCLVEFDHQENLTRYIHDLPSVEINKGDYLIEDIHEGEQIELKFSFTGAPPFTLTYVRTVEGKSKKRRVVVETHTVEEIWEHEHSVLARLEGTYEAIEVKDAYCKASKFVR